MATDEDLRDALQRRKRQIDAADALKALGNKDEFVALLKEAGAHAPLYQWALMYGAARLIEDQHAEIVRLGGELSRLGTRTEQEWAAEFARRSWSTKSPKKAAASRRNGRLGGRPPAVSKRKGRVTKSRDSAGSTSV